MGGRFDGLLLLMQCLMTWFWYSAMQLPNLVIYYARVAHDSLTQVLATQAGQREL